jgi:hypothetical protein
MSTKIPRTRHVLDAVHETARDLHAAGLISKCRMKDYEGRHLFAGTLPPTKTDTSGPGPSGPTGRENGAQG